MTVLNVQNTNTNHLWGLASLPFHTRNNNTMRKRSNEVVALLLLIATPCCYAYTADDDVSWAVRSTKLAFPGHQELYDTFMAGCRQDAEQRGKNDDCDKDEKHRLHMNNNQPKSVGNIQQVHGVWSESHHPDTHFYWPSPGFELHFDWFFEDQGSARSVQACQGFLGKEQE